MRALSLLGAGAQPWTTSVCSAQRDRLAYAATLAIYVYQYEKDESPEDPEGSKGGSWSGEWRLRAILTCVQATAVSGLAWHPARPRLLAAVTADQRVLVWCVRQQRVVAALAAPSQPTLLEWNPFERESVSFLLSEGRVLQTWSPQQGSKTLPPYREHSPFSSPACCLQWHPAKPGALVFGHQDGSLSFYTAEGVQLHRRVEGCEAPGSVCALQWDPLGEECLLVAHEGGALRLLAAPVGSAPPAVLAHFRHPAACRAACLAWLPECPGMFVSGDEDSGVLRLWTVGRESSLENRALESSGVRALHVVPGAASEHPIGASQVPGAHPPAVAALACVFKGGALGVYDLRRATWPLRKEAGHTETVFACSFRPDDSDVLATGSFDGTVKLWGCGTGEPRLVSSTTGQESIIYSVSWSPPPLSLLAAGTARGGVLLVDTTTMRVTQRLSGHGPGSSVYCVAWCQADARRLASCGADGSCLVTQHRGEIEVQRCSHPAPVFGCDWQGWDLLATGCEDGRVRVFRVNCSPSSGQQPLVLEGHTAKVFSVRWSPARRGLLASGSDDGSVRLWEVQGGAVSGAWVRELTGHKGPVRGLAWSPALPHLLVSGAWDFAVRVWDVRSGRCVQLQRDHGADVYGLSVHPLRPLLLASCSRDATVRLWSLAPLAARLSMTALLTDQQPADLIAKEFEPDEESPLRLCGPAAAHLLALLENPSLDPVHRFLTVMDTLTADPSVRNLWDLVAVQRGTREIAQLSRHYIRGVVHASHVAACHLAEGTRREVAAGSARGARGDSALREAASSYLKAGALRRYCDLLVRLGDWERALAVAPGVSVRYWRQLNQRRLAALYAEESEEALPHALAGADVQGAVRLYVNRGQLQEALSLSALQGGRADDRGEGEGEEGSLENAPSDSPPPLMVATARLLAERHLRTGAPLRAACTLLAVDDIEGALHSLLRGHELELCVAVGRALERLDDPRVVRALAMLALRARRLGDWRLTSRLIAHMPQGTARLHASLRLLARFPGPEEDRAALHRMAGLPSVPECAARARQLLAAPATLEVTVEAVRLFLAAGQTDQALVIGLPLLNDVCRPKSASWDLTEALRLTELLQETGSANPELRLLAVHVACQVAARRGYVDLVPKLVTHARSLRAAVQGSLGLSEDELHTLLTLRVSDVTDPELRAERGTVHVAGCQLPAHSVLRRCTLSGDPIRGPAVALDSTASEGEKEEEGQHFLSLSDAVMWASAGAMSPLRAAPLNPF